MLDMDGGLLETYLRLTVEGVQIGVRPSRERGNAVSLESSPAREGVMQDARA